MKRPGLLGASLICLALPLAAQQENQSAPISSPPKISHPATNSRLHSIEEKLRETQAERHIVLNVFVKDESGKPVTQLKQEDFTLLDNLQPQAIQSFQAVEGHKALAPLHIMLVLDTLDNSTKDLTYERREIESFLKRDQGHLAYPASLVLLTDTGAHVGEPSLDGNALISELRHLPAASHISDDDDTEASMDRRTSSMGRLTIADETIHETFGNREVRNLNRRFEIAVPALLQLAVDQQSVTGRVLLLWIGNGWPMLSGRQFRPDTSEMKKDFFLHIATLANALRIAQMTIYNVSSPRLSGDLRVGRETYSSFLSGVATAGQANAANLALPVLAIQTGGEVLNQSFDIAEGIASCIAEADSYYMLAFDSVPSKTPDEYHSLQVKINRPQLSTRTNTAYYAQP